MTAENSLPSLFEKIAEGDQKSLEVVFNLFYQRLIHFIIGFVKNRESAEEIVSDVFLSLWQQKEKLLHIEQPGIYLYACAKNASLNYIRKFGNQRIAYVEETGETILIESTNPLKELEKKELMLKMDCAIESLPLQCKTIFRLVKEQGFKCREVAQIMDLSTRTVETQIYKAVKKLDEILSHNRYLYKKPSYKKILLPLFIILIIFFTACT